MKNPEIERLESRLSLMEAQVDELNKMKEEVETLDYSIRITDRMLTLFLTPNVWKSYLDKAKITLGRKGRDDPDMTDEEKKVMDEFQPTFPEAVGHLDRRINERNEILNEVKKGVLVATTAIGDRIFDAIATKFNDMNGKSEDEIKRMIATITFENSLTTLTDRVDAIERKIRQ